LIPAFGLERDNWSPGSDLLPESVLGETFLKQTRRLAGYEISYESFSFNAEAETGI
jgi:hypothetical protein